MKTLISYLKSAKLLLLLGGVAFMTSCNNDYKAGLGSENNHLPPIKIASKEKEQSTVETASLEILKSTKKWCEEQIEAALQAVKKQEEDIERMANSVVQTTVRKKSEIEMKRMNKHVPAHKKNKARVVKRIVGHSEAVKQTLEQYKKAIKELVSNAKSSLRITNDNLLRKQEEILRIENGEWGRCSRKQVEDIKRIIERLQPQRLKSDKLVLVHKFLLTEKAFLGAVQESAKRRRIATPVDKEEYDLLNENIKSYLLFLEGSTTPTISK